MIRFKRENGSRRRKKLGYCLTFLLSALLATGAIEERACVDDPQSSYALYLPSNYDEARDWPLILVFDPSGRGRHAVERFQPAAEQFGYIVAASNDSRNYAGWEFLMNSAAAMWKDVDRLFAIDRNRVYTSGFSGGARVATEVAIKTEAIAGVFVHGGSFREKASLEQRFPFLMVGAAGTQDMNLREIIQLERGWIDREQPFLRLEFEGSHSWAPSETIVEALRWFELHAGAEQQHVDAFVERAQSINDPYRRRLAFEQLQRDLGEKTPELVRSELNRLLKDKDQRDAARGWEKTQRLEDRQRQKLAGLMRRAEASVADLQQQRQAIRDLERELQRLKKTTDDTDLVARLHRFVSSVGFERAVTATQNGEFGRATAFVEVSLTVEGTEQLRRIYVESELFEPLRKSEAFRRLLPQLR